MFRRAIVPVVVVAAGVLCSAASRAEEPPTPASRQAFEAEVSRYLPFFRGLFGPDYTAVAPEGYLSRWVFDLTLDWTYTDNADLTDTPESGHYSDGIISASWLRRTARTDASLEARYTQPLYRSSAYGGDALNALNVAGAGRWQALQNFSVSAGGGIDHSTESGISKAPEGVRTAYDNRFNNYDAHADYFWRLPGTFSNTGYYRYHYRDYLSDKTEGQNFRSNEASTSFEYRPVVTDTFGAGYTYSSEETMALKRKWSDGNYTTEPGFERTTHRVEGSWAHQLRFAGDDTPKTLKLSYSLDSSNESPGDEYLLHALVLKYSTALSARTDGSVWVGVQYLSVLGGGGSDQLPVAGLDVTHRFTSATKGKLWMGHAWEYADVGSRSEGTRLAAVSRVLLQLESQFARYWTGKLNTSYERGQHEGTLDGDGGDFWAAHVDGNLTVRLGEKSWAGADGNLTRRCTSEPGSSDEGDDYWLGGVGVFYQRTLWDWLSGTARLSHNWRNTDPTSDLESYRENRLYLALTARW